MNWAWLNVRVGLAHSRYGYLTAEAAQCRRHAKTRQEERREEKEEEKGGHSPVTVASTYTCL